jgi:methanogenic corrinoid protein MtbC1
MAFYSDKLFDTSLGMIEALRQGINAHEAIMDGLSKGTDAKSAGSVVIGVVEGDTHDIGKNLVKIMLESLGFEHDLGRDVPLQKFIDEAEEVRAQMICLSTLDLNALPLIE